MYRLSFWCFLSSLFMIFIIQVLTFYKNVQIRSGNMDGDLTHSMLQSSLITVPIILIAAGLVFLYYGNSKK